MRRLTKWLTILAMLTTGSWSLWWYVGARGQESGVAAWLDSQRHRGWLAEARGIEVNGYPTDFEMRATGIALADPRAGWAWTAPQLVAASRAYAPTRISVTWPSEQSFAVPGDHALIRSARMKTVLDLRPGTAMELREASTDVAVLTIDGGTGWRAGADTLVFNLSERAEEPASPNSYSLTLVADRLVLPDGVIAFIDPTGWLEPSIDRLTVRAQGAFDQALGRATVEGGDVSLRAATIREAGFTWGGMELVMSGDFRVDDAGYPVGKLEVRAREWRRMLLLAERSGMIDRTLAASITDAVEFFTRLAGTGNELKAKLGLKRGKIMLGPVAIADAPRLAEPRR